MAVFVRSRLPHTFNDKLRQRIFTSNSSSTTTDHDAVSSSSSSSTTCSSDSPCLSFLVHSFLEDTDNTDLPNRAAEDPPTAEFAVPQPPDTAALIRDIIEPSAWSNADRFRTQLLASVEKASEAFSLFNRNRSSFLRTVAAYLRQIGHDAAVCRTKWEATAGGNLAAGGHEFIDVVARDSRYVIDLEFAGEFEIARATDDYRWLIGSLPKVFVGRSGDLKRLVKVMAKEARRSMKVNGMSIPPWRKNRYMQLKWFGPYRRTVNPLADSAAVSVGSGSAAECRSVGFLIG